MSIHILIVRLRWNIKWFWAVRRLTLAARAAPTHTYKHTERSNLVQAHFCRFVRVETHFSTLCPPSNGVCPLPGSECASSAYIIDHCLSVPAALPLFLTGEPALFLRRQDLVELVAAGLAFVLPCLLIKRLFGHYGAPLPSIKEWQMLFYGQVLTSLATCLNLMLTWHCHYFITLQGVWVDCVLTLMLMNQYQTSRHFCVILPTLFNEAINHIHAVLCSFSVRLKRLSFYKVVVIQCVGSIPCMGVKCWLYYPYCLPSMPCYPSEN